MARPSKPAAVLREEGKSHRTKAELAQREKGESALLSGKRCFERASVKSDPVAHAEYVRLTKLMRSIGKDDALYAPEYNRYAELFAEELFYKQESARLREELAALRELSISVAAAADCIAERIECGEGETEQLASLLPEILEQNNSLLSQRGKLLKQLGDLDVKIKQKREMMIVIEKENCMTVSAALRTIPKQPEKPENDALIQALNGLGE